MNSKKCKELRNFIKKAYPFLIEENKYEDINVKEKVWVNPVSKKEFKYTTYTRKLDSRCRKGTYRVLKRLEAA